MDRKASDYYLMFGEKIIPQQEQYADLKTRQERNKITETVHGLEYLQKEDVRAWSKEWLEQFYNHGIQESVLRSAYSIREALHNLIGEKNKNVFTPHYREAINVFLNEFIRITKEKAKQIQSTGSAVEEEKFEQFLRATDQLVSFVAEGLHFDDLLFLTAKANRVPRAQGFAGARFVGVIVSELTYNAAWDDIERMVERTKKLPLPELLDVLNQCQTIKASAKAQGEEDAAKAIDYIITHIKLDHPSPLVAYTAELARKAEGSDPLLGSLRAVRESV